MTVRKTIEIPGRPIAAYAGNTIGVDPDEDEGPPDVDEIVPPLSTVLFADVGTGVSSAQQNGSIAAPFDDANAAISAGVNNSTVMLTPGDYGNSVDLRGTAVVQAERTFIGMGSQGSGAPVLFGLITIVDAIGRFESMGVAFDASGPVFGAEVHALNCQLGGFGNNYTLFARLCQFTGQVTGPVLLQAEESDVNVVVNAGDVVLDDCSISGSITCTGTLTIRNVRTVQAGLTLTATTIVVDSHTLRELVFAGTTFVGSVTGYSGAVFSWGAAVATVNEFLELGTRANPVSFAAENTVRFFVARRGVLCSLTAFSSAGPTTFMARRNAADSALSVVSNGAQVQNASTFQAFNPDDTLDIQVTGAAGGEVICSAVFV